MASLNIGMTDSPQLKKKTVYTVAIFVLRNVTVTK